MELLHTWVLEVDWVIWGMLIVRKPWAQRDSTEKISKFRHNVVFAAGPSIHEVISLLILLVVSKKRESQKVLLRRSGRDLNSCVS
jgi:hypothetical protein